MGNQETSYPPSVQASVPVEDLLVGIASPLTMHHYGPDYLVLPLKMPVCVGDVLVVRTEYADHPRTQKLLAALFTHLYSLANSNSEIKVLDGVLAQC